MRSISQGTNLNEMANETSGLRRSNDPYV